MSKTALRRLAMLCVAGATAFGVMGGVANATKPARGCPPAFELSGVTSETPAGVDKNGDGMVCVKSIPAPGDNFTDNTSNH